MRLYYVLACGVMALHALFIAWVVFGAAFTRRRPLLRWLHIASLVWGVLVEVLPWPCPLTLLEQWLEIRAGESSYQGGFLLHYLDMLVYPNIPPVLLTVAAVVVVIVNLGVYFQRLSRERRKRRRFSPQQL
jgi:prolipoprotein diacylglyceryltransferase